jgi:hypothetical protein
VGEGPGQEGFVRVFDRSKSRLVVESRLEANHEDFLVVIGWSRDGVCDFPFGSSVTICWKKSHIRASTCNTYSGWIMRVCVSQ